MRKRFHIARFVRSPRRLLNSTDGSAAVEFGLVAIPFLALLLGALQLLILFVAQQVLETAAEQSSRQILTGQSQALTQAQFKSVVCGNLSSFLQCNNVMIDIQTTASFAAANTAKPVLTYDKFGNVTNAFNFQQGSSGSYVVMRIMYQWPVFNFIMNLGTQANGTHLLMATSVFKSENF